MHGRLDFLQRAKRHALLGIDVAGEHSLADTQFRGENPEGFRFKMESQVFRHQNFKRIVPNRERFLLTRNCLGFSMAGMFRFHEDRGYHLFSNSESPPERGG